MRRVPPREFHASLDRFIRRVREDGARPLLLALPSALTIDRFPPYLLDMGFTGSPRAAIADHRRYAELAAEAAEAAGAPFVDLRPALPAGDGAPGAALFSPDRIHPTPEGHRRIAEALVPVVLGLLEDEADPPHAGSGQPPSAGVGSGGHSRAAATSRAWRGAGR